MEEITVKRGRGRPPKQHQKTPTGVVSTPSAPEFHMPNANKNNSVEGSPNGDIEMLESIVPGRSGRGRGRPRKHPLENGSALGFDKSISQENISGVDKDLKKMKSERSLESPLRRSSRYTLSSPHTLSDVIRQNAITDSVADDVKGSPFMNAVVKVFCVHTEPNFSLPWQRKRQFSSNSSGFIIDGRRVLTNAHSVEHHTQVKLKKRGSDTKYLATVLAIGTECDIAMLTVSDDEFWEGVSPVQFGALPTLQDAVTVVGYPIGGDTISVTSGVVSRIEVLSYVHGATELLGVQIDAAINSGNSGGPAFNDKGQCVGIAFQSLKHEDAENIGYVIPTPVITHFITDYERSGDYTGFPILGIEWQKMENPDLRIAMGMTSNQKGVRVRRVEPTAPAAKFLTSSDILLSFDGIDIANDGTVPFRRGERIGFSYLVSKKYTGEHARVKILRDSEYHEFDIELSTHKRLVPAHIKGKPPSYYIIAGFVFSALSVPYLRSEYGKDYDYDAPVKLLDKLLHSMARTEDEQLVVISQVLVAETLFPKQRSKAASGHEKLEKPPKRDKIKSENKNSSDLSPLRPPRPTEDRANVSHESRRRRSKSKEDSQHRTKEDEHKRRRSKHEHKHNNAEDFANAFGVLHRKHTTIPSSTIPPLQQWWSSYQKESKHKNKDSESSLRPHSDISNRNVHSSSSSHPSARPPLPPTSIVDSMSKHQRRVHSSTAPIVGKISKHHRNGGISESNGLSKSRRDETYENKDPINSSKGNRVGDDRVEEELASWKSSPIHLPPPPPPPPFPVFEHQWSLSNDTKREKRRSSTAESAKSESEAEPEHGRAFAFRKQFSLDNVNAQFCPSPSPDEVNRKADAFIAKVRQQIRLRK